MTPSGNPYTHGIRYLMMKLEEAGILRYFGFLSPNCAVPLEEVKARIEMAHGFAQAQASIEVEPREPMRLARTVARCCASCG